MMTANIESGQRNETRDTALAAVVHIAALFFDFFVVALVYFASDDSFTRENAANALNWHIPLSLVAILVAFIGLVVNESAGLVMAIGIVIVTVCVALIASVKARQGRAWKYPIVPNLV